MKVTTDEHAHDGKMLSKLDDEIVKSNYGIVIDGFLADGSYDKNDIFRSLSEKNIIPCIKVRKDTRVRKTSHNLKNIDVISQRNNFEQ